MVCKDKKLCCTHMKLVIPTIKVPFKYRYTNLIMLTIQITTYHHHSQSMAITYEVLPIISAEFYQLLRVITYAVVVHANPP